MSNGGELNWIVPFRRAVATREVGYADAMRAWRTELLSHEVKIAAWYLQGSEDVIADMAQPSAAPRGSFANGDRALERWITTLPGCGETARAGSSHSVAPDEQQSRGVISTISTDPIRFYPRLWKGPLRVVWEEMGGAAPPAQIYSRGLVYGAFAQLGNIWDSDYWRVHTANWGPQGLRANYPRDNSESQRAGLPVTPGWACLASVMWLFYFMLNLQDSYDSGGLLYRAIPDNSHLNGHMNVAYVISPPRNQRRIRLEIRNTPWPLIELDRGISDEQALNQAASGTSEPSSLSDSIVIVSYDSSPTTGHNIAFVKLRDPEQRARDTAMRNDPGFPSAYDPLTGQTLSSAERGEYFLYSAGGSLTPTGGPCNSRYFTFEAAPAARDAVFTVAAIREDHLQDVYANGSTPLPPIFVCNDNGALHDRQALTRFYHERAVPFPTMRESYQDLGFRTFQGGEATSVAGGAGPTSTVQFNANKEIEDGQFRFLPGDVLEFPLHKFISACGMNAFRNLEFDPDGSFLQGNSVRGTGAASSSGSGSAPHLHDNLMGMRFQLLYNLAHGAFISQERVGTNAAKGALSWRR